MNAKNVLGTLGLLLAAFGLYKLVSPKSESEGLNGYPKLPGKSNAASQVLYMMDKDYDYQDALNQTVREHTKGMSINQKKKFKSKLERELKQYI